MTILFDKEVKTRKPHTCLYCGRKFNSGVMMRKQTNIFEDQIATHYSCNTCDSIISIMPIEEVYMEGYVSELLKRDQTPEQLLLKLNTEI